MADTIIPHLLVIPFPSQGHMLPLLDLCHLLSTRSNLIITIAITPGNLPTLSPLLSSSPSISPLLLPFPSSPILPLGAENTHQLPPHLFRHLLLSLSSLLPPLLHWSNSHPNPPIAILSDFFTSSWTLPLAQSLSIPRISFSPSGAFAISTIHHLWRHMPPNSNPNLLIPFPSLPNSPSFPLSHLSNLYRTYINADPLSESIKQNFQSDAQSWGFLLNTFSDLESDYIQHLIKDVARHRRVWAVGPLVASPVERNTDAVFKEKLINWLDASPEGSVLYVCFGSQAFLSPAQAAAISAALEVSGVRFLWCVREGTEIPSGFEERVGAARGFVARGWVPQLEVLAHAAVGWFLTHCGWNSVIEAVVAGVPLLMWPRGADQFVDARLMEEAGVGIRVAEGMETVPEVEEMARVLGEAVRGESGGERKRAAELREIARKAVAEGGSSFRDLESLLAELERLAVTKKSHVESPELL